MVKNMPNVSEQTIRSRSDIPIDIDERELNIDNLKQ